MKRYVAVEASQVAEARRGIVEQARELGFDETLCGKVALATTELATNLVRHGGGGELLAGAIERGGAAGLELLCLDRGPGMADPEQCLRDGFSTGGTQGTGLGAARRQSSEWDLYTRPQAGTAILCRFWTGRSPPPVDAIAVGGLRVPKPGEAVCGDNWAVAWRDGEAVLFVADGLGHGTLAAEASREAVRLFLKYHDEPTEGLLANIHQGLRATRGAAIAVARVAPSSGQVAFGGIGNISGSVVSGGAMRKMVSQNGTAGHVARRFSEFRYPHQRDVIVILHSDGLGTSWNLDAYPGLTMRDPSLVAGVLYRDFRRGTDDSSVVVARWPR